jgi:hypothetical protein
MDGTDTMNGFGFRFVSRLREIQPRRERRPRMIIPTKVQLLILWLYICLAMVVAMMMGGMMPLSSPQAKSDSDTNRIIVGRISCSRCGTGGFQPLSLF